METSSQGDNLLKLLKLVKRSKGCKVKLITKNKMQTHFLEKLKQQIEASGPNFEYCFEDIHDRLIRTESWEINLPKGIHMFKRGTGKAEEDHVITYTPLKRFKLIG